MNREREERQRREEARATQLEAHKMDYVGRERIELLEGKLKREGLW